jgi:murein DD-endopeptidase MepM/ murein hydrolase activator NlpD
MRGDLLGRRSVAHAFLAAIVAGTLLLPAVVSHADPEDELDATRERLEDVRARLEAGESRAGTLKERIAVLERDMARLQIALHRLGDDIARVQSDVKATEAEIAETQAQIDAVEDRATKQAVALYKSGGVDILGALLDSTSLAELDARAELLGVAARENTGAIIQYGRLKVRIEHQARELLAKQELLTEQRDAKQQLLGEQSRRKAELDDAYARLADNISRLRHREGDLAEEAQQLENKIIATQAQRSVASLGTSAQGFIWPLNGPITSGYGPRWGRMHTGIDIDGYTGQPIVASKGGRVILASYYGGYGNAVIIDHGGGIATLYGHMSAFGTSNGQTVSQGQVIGNVGCTGSCTGDHLHFEVRVNGSPVNPLDYLP